MSGLFDQITNYSPPLLTAGQVNYKGTWNASTNTPTLVSPPAATTKGDYYVVSVAGTQFTISFAVGDWIISNGTAWEKVDLTDAVSSVFGRTGAVVGASTDYSSVGLTNTAIGASSPSTGAFTTVTASSTIAATGAVTGSNLSGTNTGDQTITLTGGVTGSGTGSFAATVVTNANLTGAVTSVGNATSLGSFSSANLSAALTDETGSGAAVFATSPTLTTPILGTPQSGTLSSCTGLPISTGVSGLGTGIATALAVNTGSAGAPVLFNGALGTPASGTATNLTGTSGITGTGVLNSGSITSGFGSIDVGADSISGGAGAFTSLSATGATINTTTTQSLLTLSDGGVGSYSRLNMRGGGGNLAWSLGVQDITSNALTITPSTANGGTTFSTPIATFTSTGLAVTGALSCTGSATVSGTFYSTAFVNTSNGTSYFTDASTGNGIYVGGSTATPANTVRLFANASERMRIDSTGNVGIGTSSPAFPLDVNLGLVVRGNATRSGSGMFLANDSTYGLSINAVNHLVAGLPLAIMGYPIKFLSSDTGGEHARIDTSGNLGVGVTAPAAKLEIAGDILCGTQSLQTLPSASNAGFYFANPYNVAAARFSGGSYTGALTLINVYNGNGVVGTVVTNGTGTSWNTTSDARLKTNLRDITNSSAIIDALKPRRFDWLTASQEKDDYGFVAQEAYEVYPKMVSVGGDDPAEKPWAVDPSKLISILVAELQSVRQRLAALESN